MSVLDVDDVLTKDFLKNKGFTCLYGYRFLMYKLIRIPNTICVAKILIDYDWKLDNILIQSHSDADLYKFGVYLPDTIIDHPTKLDINVCISDDYLESLLKPLNIHQD